MDFKKKKIDSESSAKHLSSKFLNIKNYVNILKNIYLKSYNSVEFSTFLTFRSL